MYKIFSTSIVNNLKTRGYILSKKFSKLNKKQTLDFLRAPKHFNIGKHKVLSFKNIKTETFILEKKINYNDFKNVNFLFIHSLNNLFKLNLLYSINSIVIKTKIKIKWFSDNKYSSINSY